MKLAFVVYPQIHILDLLLAADPLKHAEKMGLLPKNVEWDFCAYEVPSEEVRSALSDSRQVRLNPESLAEFDLVCVIGSRMDTLPDELNPMLDTINPHAGLVLTGNALVLEQKFNKVPVFAAEKRGEVLALGYKLCALAAGQEVAAKVAESFGISLDLLDIKVIKKREGSVSRKTKETSIDLTLALDGSGKHEIDTGIPFFDHMLSQIAVHGLFDLDVRCKGDLQVDPHHTVEDVGLALGKAFDQALGDRKGLVRMASATVPMDECLAQVNLDLSGRAYTVVQADWQDVRIGDLPVSLIPHFLESFATQARCNLFVRLLAAGDDHHRAEAIFKALARALDSATQIDPRRLQSIPSSKGVI